MTPIRGSLLPWGIAALLAAILAAFILRNRVLRQSLERSHRDVVNLLAEARHRAGADPTTPTKARMTGMADSPPVGSRVVFDPNTRNTALNRESRRIRIQRTIQQDYSDIISTLNIDPAKRTRLLELLAEKHMSASDVKDTLADRHIVDLSLQNQAIDEAEHDSDQQIEALVGADVVAKLNSFDEIKDTYVALRETIALDIGYSGQPMSVEQEVALATAMKAAGYSPMPSPSASVTGVLGEQPIQTPEGRDALFKQAATILTPEQMASFVEADNAKVAQEQVLDGSLALALHRPVAGP
jgi:hypothetical protein